MKERVAWVDVAKGIAMFLVVLGYNPLSDSWMRIIYSLNVPIFFLMSGFTFHAGQYDNLGQLVKRLAKSLLIPYVFLNLLAYPVFCYTQGRMPDLESAKQLFFGMLYGVGDAGSLRFNIPLWFLPCTCMIECLYYLLDKYSKKTKPIWVLVSAVLGYFSFPLFNIRLPWGLDAAFTGLVFLRGRTLFLQRTRRQGIVQAESIPWVCADDGFKRRVQLVEPHRRAVCRF